MLRMWALVSLKLVLGLEVWLVLRVLTSWLSTLANCLLVLLFQQSFNYEQVKDVGLLAVKLVLGLVAGASSQLISLFVRTMLGPGTGKTVWPDWIVLDRDFRNDWPLWWICFECHEVFGR